MEGRGFIQLHNEPSRGSASLNPTPLYHAARVVENTASVIPSSYPPQIETFPDDVRKEIESIRRAVFFVQMELAVFMFLVLLLL